MTMEKQIKAIYAELQAYLTQAPVLKEPYDTTSDKTLWEQLNYAVEELQRLTGQDYSRYRITPQNNEWYYSTHISEYRNKLAGLIERLRIEYISPEKETNNLNRDETDSDEPMPTSLYIKEEIIEAIKSKNDGFNYKKLTKLITELNKNYLLSNAYSCLALIRAITDHIPPLLGYTTFEEVVNNYKGSKTDKDYLIKLFNDRPVSDDSLHRVISHSEDLIDMDDIPNKRFLNRLLQECLEKTVQVGFKHKAEIKPTQFKNVKKVTDPLLRPILRAELTMLRGGPDGYFVGFTIRNVGKGLATLRKVELGTIEVPIRETTLAENEKHETSSMNIEGTALRKGEVENPELKINYDNIDNVKFETVYNINLEERADKLFNVQSFTDPKFIQVT